jgi:hypothetical protein
MKDGLGLWAKILAPAPVTHRLVDDKTLLICLNCLPTDENLHFAPFLESG